MAHVGLRQSVGVSIRQKVRRVGRAQQADQQHATLEEAKETLGDSFVWRSVKFKVVGGVLQWHTRQGELITVDSRLSRDC